MSFSSRRSRPATLPASVVDLSARLRHSRARVDDFARLALLVALCGCGPDLDDEDLGVVDDSAFGGTDREGVIEPEGGFADGAAIELVRWDLRVGGDAGLEVVEVPRESEPDEIDVFAHATPAPMYVLYDSSDEPLVRLAAEGTEVRGQYPIVDVFGAEGVSGLWQVVAVGAPSDYEENQIKSVDTLFAADFGMQETEIVVACIPVPEDASVAAAAPALPRMTVWFEKRRGTCILADGGSALVDRGAPLFDVPARVVADTIVLSVVAMPLYELRATVFGEEEPIVGNRLVDAVPEGSGYAPLVLTHAVPVPADYAIGTLSSFAAVDDALVEVDRDASGVVVEMLTVLGAP